MWTVLKTIQSKKLNYEQIRNAIKTPKLGALFSDDGDLTLVQENRRRKALRILERTRITWKRNPIEGLIEKLEAADLKIDLFGESPTIFNKLKCQLSILFYFSGFRKYHIFLESVNQKDYQWQIYTIWKVLFDMKLEEECYRLRQAMLQIERNRQKSLTMF